MTVEWLLGIGGGILTLNITINKLLSNKKENKWMKSVDDSIAKKFQPYDEKFKSYDKKFSCIEKDITDIKVFIGKTETNFEYIKEYLEDLKELSTNIFVTTNRTRENIPYAKLEHDDTK
jgi:phosphoglycolate phosphatase-like HAD superfamily hydrolase